MFSRRIFAKRGRMVEIPCIFPCQRELSTLEYCELDPRPSRQGADRWGTEHARNTHTTFAAAGIFSAPPPRNLNVGSERLFRAGADPSSGRLRTSTFPRKGRGNSRLHS